MDLSKGDMLIFAGEGTRGTWTRYYGLRTRRAILARLTRERAHGDRWASVWISAKAEGLIESGELIGSVYVQLNSAFEPDDMRSIIPGQIQTDPASEAARTLGRAKTGSRKAQAASRANGAKGGRPRRKA